MIFFIGFVLFAPAVSDTRQRYLIGWAIAVMVAGLAIPVISPVPVSVDAVIGGALLIGGGLTAIMLSVTKGEYQRDRA
jgi:hypothetical protein